MRIKKYVVAIQVTGQFDIEVKAPSFKIAVDKASFLLPQMDWNKLKVLDYKYRVVNHKKED